MVGISPRKPRKDQERDEVTQQNTISLNGGKVVYSPSDTDETKDPAHL